MILKFRRNTPRNLILEASRSFAQVVRGELVENISFFLYGSCMLIIYSVCHAIPCMLLHGGCHAHPKKLFVSANRTFSTSPPMPCYLLHHHHNHQSKTTTGWAVHYQEKVLLPVHTSKKMQCFFLEKPDFFAKVLFILRSGCC